MTGSHLQHLTESEVRALQEYVHRLLTQQGPEVVEVWLFGSKARGDFDSDSGLDVLVILNNGNHQSRDLVRLTAARVSLEDDVLINMHVLSQEQWRSLADQQTPYWQNVQRDGVLLLPGAAGVL
jgi:predicted nucleotidyltransferase